MNKVVILLSLVMILGGCNTNSTKEVTCKMDDSVSQAGVNVVYTYDQDNKVTHIKTTSYFAFSKAELNEVSLDDYYQQIKAMYKDVETEDGVKIKINKNEKKNRVNMVLNLDTEYYDLEDDILNVSTEGDFNDVTTFVDMKKALGVYECGKVK